VILRLQKLSQFPDLEVVGRAASAALVGWLGHDGLDLSSGKQLRSSLGEFNIGPRIRDPEPAALDRQFEPGAVFGRAISRHGLGEHRDGLQPLQHGKGQADREAAADAVRADGAPAYGGAAALPAEFPS
jgi:hypothetical protein